MSNQNPHKEEDPSSVPGWDAFQADPSKEEQVASSPAGDQVLDRNKETAQPSEVPQWGDIEPAVQTGNLQTPQWPEEVTQSKQVSAPSFPEPDHSESPIPEQVQNGGQGADAPEWSQVQMPEPKEPEIHTNEPESGNQSPVLPRADSPLPQDRNEKIDNQEPQPERAGQKASTKNAPHSSQTPHTPGQDNSGKKILVTALLIALCVLAAFLLISKLTGSKKADTPVNTSKTVTTSAKQTQKKQVTPTPAVSKKTTKTTTKAGGKTTTATKPQTENKVTRGQPYSTKDQVALYIHLYKELPPNYLTKKQAESKGWDATSGNLWQVAPQMSIGGDSFGNFEGQLPGKKGRSYTECDINYNGGRRGAERIIFSNDGLIFYTGDHYATFEQLY